MFFTRGYIKPKRLEKSPPACSVNVGEDNACGKAGRISHIIFR